MHGQRSQWLPSCPAQLAPLTVYHHPSPLHQHAYIIHQHCLFSPQSIASACPYHPSEAPICTPCGMQTSKDRQSTCKSGFSSASLEIPSPVCSVLGSWAPST